MHSNILQCTATLQWHPGSEAMNDVLVLGKILLHALPWISLFPHIAKGGDEASEMPFIALLKRLLHLLDLASALLMFMSPRGDLQF